MRLSVIIPAYNEERYLPETLGTIREAARHFQGVSPSSETEVIVVDNDSSDRTVEIARQEGCRVVEEKEHNIGAVRNAGAREAVGDVLVFIDADTLVPVNVFALIADRVGDPNCVGGAVRVRHRPSNKVIQLYCFFWKLLGDLTDMKQGATQFCRKSVFHELGGYDETVFMGEDVEFYWKMKRRAKEAAGHLSYIDDVAVLPSPRRYDQWPIWKTLFYINPFYAAVFKKTRKAWPGWYETRPK